MPTNGKRVAYGRNQVRVAIATYPDDTSVPVRTSHWNQDPHDQAILGFTKVTATLDASGIIYTKDDSSTYLEDNGSTYSRQSTLIEVECTGSTTTDAIAKIDVTDTLENDILYLFKGTAGDTITIASATPSVAGHIKTQLSGGATLVHDGVPIMLIRRGDYWYEFGADGAASTPYAAPTIGSTSIASGSTNATIAGLTLTTPNIGTPSAGTLTSCTGLPITGITSSSSAQIATLCSDETGSGALVFGTAPTITLANGTGLPPAGVTGTAAILGANTFTASQDIGGFDIDNVQNLVHDITTDTGVTGTKTISFAEDQLKDFTVTGNVTLSVNNRAAGKSTTVRLVASGADRTITYPAFGAWVGGTAADGSNQIVLASGKTAILTLTCFGTAISTIVAAYAVEA
jgi:hypothetical protein